MPAALLALLVRFRSSPVRLFIIWPDQAAGRRHVLVTMLRPNGEEEEVHADVHPTAAGGIKVRAGTRVRVNVYID